MPTNAWSAFFKINKLPHLTVWLQLWMVTNVTCDNNFFFTHCFVPFIYWCICISLTFCIASGHLVWHVGRCSASGPLHILVWTITSCSNTWWVASDFRNLSFVLMRCKLPTVLFFVHILPYSVSIATHWWQDAGHPTLKIVQHLTSCSKSLVQFESTSGYVSV